MVMPSRSPVIERTSYPPGNDGLEVLDVANCPLTDTPAPEYEKS